MNWKTRLKAAREAIPEYKKKIRFAEAVSISPATATDWEKSVDEGGIEKISGQNLMRVCEVLNIDADWLLYGTGRQGRAVLEAAQFNAGEPQPLPASRRAPIVGIAIGGPDGYMNIDDYPAGDGDGYVVSNSTDPHAYAIRVRGDSMRPRIRSGEYIVAEPSREPMPGGDVVVKLKDGRAMVKEWMWTREGEICLGSVNDTFAPMTIPLADIESIHKVAAILPFDTKLFASKRGADASDSGEHIVGKTFDAISKNIGAEEKENERRERGQQRGADRDVSKHGHQKGAGGTVKKIRRGKT